ncbi:MAG: acyl-ACP--UDP-N-acetylglucosamine O-acyltransferase, partial [Gemmatimonadales bacterium]
QVTIGPRTVVAARAIVERNVRLGADCLVGTGSIVGGDPQDLKFKGEETWVEIGDGTVIREYVTVNRGTSQSFKTTVGRKCLLMSYVHVAHDCHIGNEVIISNAVQMAGHITIGDCVTISGLTPIHQFVKIGAYAFIGGLSRVTKDVPPYVKAAGSPMKLYGLNTIGLQRRGFAPETMRELKRAYMLFFQSDLNLSQALERARAELPPLPEVQLLIKFVEESERGVLV